MLPPGIIVVCRRPGLIRGGLRNGVCDRYDAGTLAPAQLAELVAEPEITVVLGSVITAEDIAQLYAEDAEKAPDLPGDTADQVAEEDVDTSEQAAEVSAETAADKPKRARKPKPQDA